MPMRSISTQPSTISSISNQSESGDICAALERGSIVYFPQSPIRISSKDTSFLLQQQQSTSKRHKNIAYKPARQHLSGIDPQAISAIDLVRLKSIMSSFSQAVADYLATFLAPYGGGWRLDYASFRPFEEKNRDLPVRHRNDLLHTDAFPTRPTHGARILRFFVNLNPDRNRDWVCTDPFETVVRHFTPAKLALPEPLKPVAKTAKNLARTAGIARIFPQLNRTPYDEFMMRLHDTMKEDSAFQMSCPKEHFSFPPGSSWMVYTETVPHAVLAGQFALEQTFLVSPSVMVDRSSSPLSILEKMAGARLV